MYSAIVPVTKENVMALVTPYDIFRKYVNNYDVEKSVHSPFAVDVHASFWSVIDANGRIWFKDLARKIEGDCFDLVMNLFHTDFKGALEQINEDFELGLGKPGTDYDAVQTRLKKFQLEPPKPKELANIQIAPRQWELYDLQYWAEHGISYETLCKYFVVPIKFYWVREYQFPAERLAYSWKVYDKRKVYQPTSEGHKWYGDLRSNYVQGLQQLPQRGKKLLIQSSLKDAMSCLERYNILGVAGSSETTPIPEFILDDLDSRFDEIFVVHDGDRAGWETGTELAYQRRYVNVMLPSNEHVKDPSAYVKHGQSRRLDALFKLYNVIE